MESMNHRDYFLRLDNGSVIHAKTLNDNINSINGDSFTIATKSKQDFDKLRGIINRKAIFWDKLYYNQSDQISSGYCSKEDDEKIKKSIFNKIYFDKNDETLWVDVMLPDLYFIDNNIPNPPFEKKYCGDYPSYYLVKGQISDERLMEKQNQLTKESDSITIDKNVLCNILLRLSGLIRITVDITSYYNQFQKKLQNIWQNYCKDNPNAVNYCNFEVNKYFINNEKEMKCLHIDEANERVYYDTFVPLNGRTVSAYDSGVSYINQSVYHRLQFKKSRWFFKLVFPLLKKCHVGCVCKEWKIESKLLCFDK